MENDECKKIYDKLKSMNIDPNPLTYPEQPERSKREDINYYGMKAQIKEDGLCYFEDGKIIDLSQMIDDAVL